MKKLFSFMALLAIITLSNCSEIPENNDPILGIWVKSEINTETSKNNSRVREEWIFNDVFLGRYHNYTNNELTFFTDFRWDNNEGEYTIIYTGTDIPNAEVRLEQSANPEKLALNDGATFAERE